MSRRRLPVNCDRIDRPGTKRKVNTMACQCGCCDTPAPQEGTEAQERELTKEDLQVKVVELDRRVKELETSS